MTRFSFGHLPERNLGHIATRPNGVHQLTVQRVDLVPSRGAVHAGT